MASYACRRRVVHSSSSAPGVARTSSAAATAAAASASDIRSGRSRCVIQGASSRAETNRPPAISRKPLKITGLLAGRMTASTVHSVAVEPSHGTIEANVATTGTAATASHGWPLSTPPSQVKTVTTATATSRARARAPYGPVGAARAT